MRRPTKETIGHLANLLEWAVGNRGDRRDSGSPYAVPEVRAALKHLAELHDFDINYLDVNLRKLAKLAEKEVKAETK